MSTPFTPLNHSLVPPGLLLVDDDDNDIFFFRKALERAGVTNSVQVATDGQMAKDYLAGAGRYADRTQYPLPALVLLDLKLPKQSGLEVLEWMRGQGALKTLVVIVLSSSPDAAEVRRAYECGANSFVTKPLDIQQLSELARRLKGWWLECNQFAPV